MLLLNYVQDAYQILHEVHDRIVGLGPDLDYSQAALIYGVRMETAVALEMNFDQALELVQQQFSCIHFLAHKFCKLLPS